MKLKDLKKTLDMFDGVLDEYDVCVLDHSKGDYFPVEEISITTNLRNNKPAITLTSYGVEEDVKTT